jgi:hypothetical protein
MTRSYVYHNQPEDHPNESYCSREKIWKPKSEFHYYDKEQGILAQICRQCQQELRRDGYTDDRDRVLAQNKAWTEKAKETAQEYVYQYLLEHPCVDCGETNVLTLTFDHQRDKKSDLSIMIARGRSLETIKAEISRCEVVCFNCHMKRERIKRGGR